jgi:two-component system CheB/CheR fusion protein
LFERAGVRLELEMVSRPVHVLADRIRVGQIIGNLLQNAAKFTCKGGSTRVTLGAEGKEAVIRVADDGVGMTRETLQRLFQAFMQADQTLERSQGGLGLGLALVKGLVELHGGSVAAASEGIGKGAELTVRLPLDVGAALATARQMSGPGRKRRRVLIIEDNLDAADSLREVLELGEHEVEVAHDGPDGIAKARASKPHLVLCDIGLPGMDGFEVARAFRADGTLKKTYLVALSGYALPEDLQRAAHAGFEQHLPKPPSIDVLEDLLAKIPDEGAPA